MSKTSDALEKLLSEKLDYPCKVYYYKGSRDSWLFETDKTNPQRIGFTYKQAATFIKAYDWTWLKNHLKKT